MIYNYTLSALAGPLTQMAWWPPTTFIPVQAEYYALEGLGQLLKTVELVKDNIKPELKVLGAVLTMFDSRNRLSEEVYNELYKYFPNNIFRTVIPRTVRLAEAPSFGQSIFIMNPAARARGMSVHRVNCWTVSKINRFRNYKIKKFYYMSLGSRIRRL